MIAPCVRHWMSARDFRDEGVRRAWLVLFRRAAARSGYRGRVSFGWDTLHGRDQHLVKVSIYP